MASPITKGPFRALFVGLTAVTFVFATACASEPKTPEEPPLPIEAPNTIDAELAAQLDDVIDATIKRVGIPGAVVAISGPDGRYEHTAGIADKANGSPYRTDFFHRIGSVTKTFTVTGILQLVGDGKIGLDDPISKYLDGVPEGDKITIRMLARMQSGLPDYSENKKWVTDFLADPDRTYTPQQLLDYAFAEPMQFAPGTKWKYTNSNLIVLGLVLEKVSGQSIQDYISEHILKPLEMDDTIFPTSAAFPEPHAQGYTVQTSSGDEAIATDWNPSWGWAAGAMISTVDDLKIWAPALAKGTLLKPEVQKERLDMVSVLDLPPPNGYGLALFNLGGWIGHNGSLPGYETVVVYLPEKDLTMVITINTDEIFEGSEPSTTVAEAVTKVLTPENVYSLPAEAQ